MENVQDWKVLLCECDKCNRKFEILQKEEGENVYLGNECKCSSSYTVLEKMDLTSFIKSRSSNPEEEKSFPILFKELVRVFRERPDRTEGRVL